MIKKCNKKIICIALYNTANVNTRECWSGEFKFSPSFTAYCKLMSGKSI